MEFHYPPIGTLHTCFKEKFGVPRQSLMMSEARGVLKLNPDPAFRVAVNHLEKFSHLWLVFVFHKTGDRAWRPTIDPPRLDAADAMGVFATRSPHRPNPLGLSAVKLERIDLKAPGGVEIHLSGVDILDGTPVLDIKPYLPYTDRIAEANSGWATAEIERFEVSFSPESLATIETHSEIHPQIKVLVQQMLELDPRPTSQRRAIPIKTGESLGKKFAFRVLGLDIHWEIRNQAIYVTHAVLCP